MKTIAIEEHFNTPMYKQHVSASEFRNFHLNDLTASSNLAQARDDAWIPSSCARCYDSCSILVHRVDRVVVKVDGNPEGVVGKGRLCGKGVSGIMSNYDPHRPKVPLRRSNRSL